MFMLHFVLETRGPSCAYGGGVEATEGVPGGALCDKQPSLGSLGTQRAKGLYSKQPGLGYEG